MQQTQLQRFKISLWLCVKFHPWWSSSRSIRYKYTAAKINHQLTRHLLTALCRIPQLLATFSLLHCLSRGRHHLLCSWLRCDYAGDDVKKQCEKPIQEPQSIKPFLSEVCAISAKLPGTGLKPSSRIVGTLDQKLNASGSGVRSEQNRDFLRRGHPPC